MTDYKKAILKIADQITDVQQLEDFIKTYGLEDDVELEKKYWELLYCDIPHAEERLSPTCLLQGDEAEDITDQDLVEAEKAQRYLMLFIHFIVNNDILVSTPD